MAGPGIDVSEITRGFRAERNEALHRVLRRLPYDFIVALIEGLEAADVITPGRLFAGHSGGCAVGVTLRAMEPRYRGRRIVWGRLVRRSVVTLRRRLPPASPISTHSSRSSTARCAWLSPGIRGETHA